jgi:hypothetical protein
MASKTPTCQAEWTLEPVEICTEYPTVYFRLAKPYLPPTMKIQGAAAAARWAGFTVIECCNDHADRIEGFLVRCGYQPKRIIL